jgi:hypothetical protein
MVFHTDDKTSDRPVAGQMSTILTALSGIFGQLALGVYYSGILVPRQLMSGDATMQRVTEIIAPNQVAIFWDAYLQGIGSLLTVIFFIRLVYLSGFGSRFSGWMVLITSSVILSIALLDVTFTVAAVNSALAKHTETLRVTFDFIAGSTEAFDYTFLFIPAPVLIISLGAVLVKSNLLPRVFGYMAIVIGFAFIIVGVISLFKTLAGFNGMAFEVVQIIQVMWVLTAAVFILIKGRRKRKAV